MVENCHVRTDWARWNGRNYNINKCHLFDHWLNFRLVQSSFRQVELKCRLPTGQAKMLIAVERCVWQGSVSALLSIKISSARWNGRNYIHPGPVYEASKNPCHVRTDWARSSRILDDEENATPLTLIIELRHSISVVKNPKQELHQRLRELFGRILCRKTWAQIGQDVVDQNDAVRRSTAQNTQQLEHTLVHAGRLLWNTRMGWGGD